MRLDPKHFIARDIREIVHPLAVDLRVRIRPKPSTPALRAMASLAAVKTSRNALAVESDVASVKRAKPIRGRYNAVHSIVCRRCDRLTVEAKADSPVTGSRKRKFITTAKIVESDSEGAHPEAPAEAPNTKRRTPDEQLMRAVAKTDSLVAGSVQASRKALHGPGNQRCSTRCA